MQKFLWIKQVFPVRICQFTLWSVVQSAIADFGLSPTTAPTQQSAFQTNERTPKQASDWSRRSWESTSVCRDLNNRNTCFANPQIRQHPTMISVSIVQPSINLEFLCTYKNLKRWCFIYMLRLSAAMIS